MRRLLSRRLCGLCLGIATLIAAIFLTCWHYDVWSLRDFQSYWAMSEECHPIWKELQARRVDEGQALEELMARFPPSRVDEQEGLVALTYYKHGHRQPLQFTGVTITARDGRLASAVAWSCTWYRVFFGDPGWGPVPARAF
jgi:hypothetical protein